MAKKVDAAILAARTAVQAALQQAKQDAADAKLRAKRIREARYTLLQPVLTRIALLLAPLPEKQRSFYVQAYAMYDTPEIRVSLSNQDSLKSDVICELLEYCSSICTKGARSSDYVSAHWAERSHTFRGEHLNIRVSIDVSESGTCRKVIKGTKTVQQDEYEFVCD